MSATLPQAPALARRSILPCYIAEGLASVAGTLLTLGIFFYTAERFQWGRMQNFLLAIAEGITYVIGALIAGRVSKALGRRRGVVATNLIMAALAVAAMLAPWPIAVAGILVLYSMTIGIHWPMLESLVSSDVDAIEMSRRIGIYNLVWAGTGAAAFALEGALIQYWPAGFFLIPAVIHAANAAVMAKAPPSSAAPAPHVAEPAHSEPALVHQRRLALVLSRIVMPAEYCVIYSLTAMLPSLAIINAMPPVQQTLVCSVWLITRWVAFLALGATVWWHTRPRLLLGASILMLAAFLGIVLPADRIGWWSDMSQGNTMAWIIAAQVVLGLMIGIIYMASLYFGMVLSEGSTEHGGYHEALIGLGIVLGPSAGALAHCLRPGDASLSIIAVTAVTGLSVLAAIAATLKLRNSR